MTGPEPAEMAALIRQRAAALDHIILEFTESQYLFERGYDLGDRDGWQPLTIGDGGPPRVIPHRVSVLRPGFQDDQSTANETHRWSVWGTDVVQMAMPGPENRGAMYLVSPDTLFAYNHYAVLQFLDFHLYYNGDPPFTLADALEEPAARLVGSASGVLTYAVRIVRSDFSQDIELDVNDRGTPLRVNSIYWPASGGPAAECRMLSLDFVDVNGAEFPREVILCTDSVAPGPDQPFAMLYHLQISSVDVDPTLTAESVVIAPRQSDSTVITRNRDGTGERRDYDVSGNLAAATPPVAGPASLFTTARGLATVVAGSVAGVCGLLLIVWRLGLASTRTTA